MVLFISCIYLFILSFCCYVHIRKKPKITRNDQVKCTLMFKNKTLTNYLHWITNSNNQLLFKVTPTQWTEKKGPTILVMCMILFSIHASKQKSIKTEEVIKYHHFDEVCCPRRYKTVNREYVIWFCKKIFQ